VPTYLITGGSGFIGSHLAERLLAAGNDVVALDNLSTGRLENLAAIIDQPHFRFVQGSVLDQLMVDELMHDVDVVVHLAAAVGVKLIVEQPLRSLTTNLRGSEIVIESAHRYRRKILIASTSEIYGKNSNVPLAETADRVLGSPAVARWAYSSAKGIDEVLAYAYHKERGLPCVVVRLFNTVGPRQRATYGMVIPRLVQQAVAGEPLTVYGDGTQSRCFCHVIDVGEALSALLNSDEAIGDVFNVGSEEEITMLELAQRIIERSESPSEIAMIPYDEAYEEGFEDMQRRVPDTTKLRRLTGWAPTRDLTTVLDEAIAEARLRQAGVPGAPVSTRAARR
jgi:UDP-glucose 4-epimerase